MLSRIITSFSFSTPFPVYISCNKYQHLFSFFFFLVTWIFRLVSRCVILMQDWLQVSKLLNWNWKYAQKEKKCSSFEFRLKDFNFYSSPRARKWQQNIFLFNKDFKRTSQQILRITLNFSMDHQVFSSFWLCQQTKWDIKGTLEIGVTRNN